MRQLKFNLNSGRSPHSVLAAKSALREAEPWWTVWVDPDNLLVVGWGDNEPPECVITRVLEFFDLSDNAVIGPVQ